MRLARNCLLKDKYFILYFLLFVCFVYPNVQATTCLILEYHHSRPSSRLATTSSDTWCCGACWTRSSTGSSTAEGHRRSPIHSSAMCYQCWWQTRQDRLRKLAFSSRGRWIDVGMAVDRDGVKRSPLSMPGRFFFFFGGGGRGSVWIENAELFCPVSDCKQKKVKEK